MAGTVFIVGAGPGDPELLTLKAARVLQRADAIVYDRLINPDILRMAPPGTELIYVGKEEGYHAVEQAEINRILVRCAQKYRTVVRLKGGDPHVFGRGSEEELYLRECHVRFEVIPGISSSIAAPTYAGIPVTHRNLAASYAVITGHLACADETGRHNWSALAGIDTLVVMMGIKNRSRIAGLLIQNGRDPQDPVAFISEGTTSNQKVTVTTLLQLVDNPVEVPGPAVMIIGKVVSLHHDLAWFSPAVHLDARWNGALLLASPGAGTGLTDMPGQARKIPGVRS